MPFVSHPRIAAGVSKVQLHQSRRRLVPSIVNDSCSHTEKVIIGQESSPLGIERVIVSRIISRRENQALFSEQDVSCIAYIVTAPVIISRNRYQSEHAAPLYLHE